MTPGLAPVIVHDHQTSEPTDQNLALGRVDDNGHLRVDRTFPAIGPMAVIGRILGGRELLEHLAGLAVQQEHEVAPARCRHDLLAVVIPTREVDVVLRQEDLPEQLAGAIQTEKVVAVVPGAAQ